MTQHMQYPEELRQTAINRILHATRHKLSVQNTGAIGELQCIYCNHPATCRVAMQDGAAVVHAVCCAKCATLPVDVLIDRLYHK